jgi:hypothetical protein
LTIGMENVTIIRIGAWSVEHGSGCQDMARKWKALPVRLLGQGLIEGRKDHKRGSTLDLGKIQKIIGQRSPRWKRVDPNRMSNRKNCLTLEFQHRRGSAALAGTFTVPSRAYLAVSARLVE